VLACAGLFAVLGWQRALGQPYPYYDDTAYGVRFLVVDGGSNLSGRPRFLFFDQVGLGADGSLPLEGWPAAFSVARAGGSSSNSTDPSLRASPTARPVAGRARRTPTCNLAWTWPAALSSSAREPQHPSGDPPPFGRRDTQHRRLVLETRTEG